MGRRDVHLRRDATSSPCFSARDINPSTLPPARKHAISNWHMKILPLFVLLVLPLAPIRMSHAADGETQAARHRFLVLDSRIIASTDNAKLAAGTVTKHPGNPLFGEDKPWEKRFDNLYGNVIFDHEEQIYKCWYSPFIVDHSSRGMTRAQRDAKRYRPPSNREMGICYATSKDGIVWTKPSLGLVDFEGTTANNIIWRGPHGAGITKDSREPDTARRYKMLMQGVSTSYSADGLHWSKPRKLSGLGKVAGDTHNNLFWNRESRHYVGITRTWGPLGRQVTRLQSSDFDNWQNTGVILEATKKPLQPYSMPVFFHGGVYLGLVAIHAQRPVDRVWTELAWSPDSKTWNRISPGEPLIPCSERVLDYDYGCVYACAYPIFLKDGIRLYYGGSDYYHYGWRTGNLSLATLRPDGFAGYEQLSPDKPAIITTTEIQQSSNTLQISADVQTGGSVIVTILNADGKPIANPISIRESVSDTPIELAPPANNGKIKLKIAIERAKVYSFSFGK